MAMTVDGTPIGECLYPLETDMTDYSRFERDTWGNITVIPRGYSDTITYTVVTVGFEQAQQVRQLLLSKRAVSASYQGHPDIPITHIAGYLRSLKMELIEGQVVKFTFTVESNVTQGGGGGGEGEGGGEGGGSGG